MQTKVLGAYAEYLLIPERIGRINVFEKPDHVPFPIASLLEPLSCVAQGVLKLQLHGALDQPGKTHALVIGPGAIGLMFVNALLQVGVRRVTLAGRNPDRLDLGQKLGAETIRYSDLPATGDADIVIECTGMPEVWERSTWLTRRGGTVMWFGGCPSGSTVSLDTGRVHYDQITLLSPFHFGTFAVRTAREWLLDAPAKYEGLLSGTRTLAEASETFASLERGEGLKYVFLPGGED
jgi:L-iditol 2-dehydrogenase